MCADLLLSRPLCVYMFVFGGGGSGVLELLFHFNIFIPLTPQMLPSTLFPAPRPPIFFFFAPAASLLELFPLPPSSFSAVARFSPLSLFLSYLGFPTLSLCGW